MNKINYALWLLLASYTPISTAAEKLSISYVYADAYSLTPDIDADEVNLGLEIDFNLSDTSGRGVHLSVNDPNKLDFIGFTYLAADHYDYDRMSHAHTDLGMVEMGLNSYREYFGPVELYVGGSLNLGWYRIKLPGLKTENNPAAGATIFMESLIDWWLKVRFSGSFFGSGQPGETVTNAYYFSLSAGVEF